MTVEADETYFGDKNEITTRTIRGKSGHSSKRAIVSLVERGGKVRSFHVDSADKKTVTQIVRANVDRESTFYTDESRLYGDVRGGFEASGMVRHTAGEYVRYEAGDVKVHTNTVEGFYSIFKRGMKGVYQHCSEKHLHRYLAEFDFRYSNRVKLGIDDSQRAGIALKGISGKRLKYGGTYA